MNIQEVNYTEENEDDFYDWIQDLRISKDISYTYQSDVSSTFSDLYEVDELGLHCDKSALIRSKSVSITNPSRGNVSLSSEIWAFKIGNGYLVTDPIAFSF